MGGAHILLAFVCLIAAAFAWQIRKESDKLLFFLIGIGVGCAMAALVNQ